MRKFRYCFVLLLFLALMGCSYAQDVTITLNDTEHNQPSALLFKDLLKRLNPESMILILDGEPAEDGTVRHLYMDVNGASFDGFRLDNLRIETVFGKFNPVHEWAKGEEVVVENVMQGYVHATVREKDINCALVKITDDHWKDIKVDIRPGEIFAMARYYVEGSVSLKILVEVTTGLRMTGKQVWLDDYRLEVNNAEKTSVIKDEIEKFQPVLDMGEFIFPLDLKEISLDEEKIVFASRVEPKSFEGIRYVFSSGKVAD